MHAKLFENGRWYVQDYGLNGTKVDNERIDQKTPLEHMAWKCIGDVRFRFTLPDQVRPTSQYKAISADTLEATNTIP